jgi:hypothetical protein
MSTVQEWLDEQSRIPDGDPDDGVQAPDFPREDDPELFDAAERYLDLRDGFLDLRDGFEDAASHLADIMTLRGWEAR